MSADQTELFNAFLHGVIVMGHATAGLFFLRFWKRTSDRLFAMFAAAFWLLGLIRMAMMFFNDPGENHYLYWFRLAAYLMILAAIADKNWRK